MRYKLVDVREEHIQNRQFGTCELCYSVGEDTDSTFFFEDERGNIHEVDGFLWDYGDKFNIYVDNVIRFAKWIDDHQDYVNNSDYEPLTFAWLHDLADEYHENREEWNAFDE